MTKSKKQRTQERNKAHERHNLFVLGAAVASILIIVLALAN